MKLFKEGNDEFSLHLSEEQILVMFSCMRETFATLDTASFDTRLGASSAVVSAMAQELMALIAEAGIDP
ncbi:hypothetical protein [Stenotrophomonas panacihumi]|uniref:hypothetical protein n=1 Tax=Stenotrophomonas panacihumi TaxID=676599 RepID=UPI000A508158|nr:hypothetical protein [Stenotrophomonas panacihumi]